MQEFKIISELEMPIVLSVMIQDFLRPITRPDWRQGSFVVQTYRNEYNPYCINNFRLLLSHHIFNERVD
jgi:hypothetical protein